MSVPLSDVVFCFDMNRIEVIGGVRHLWDYGPNGFHFAFPGGAANPTPTTDGALSFDGGDYLALPAARLAEFYQKMPTREHTWLASYSTVAGVADAPLWSCYTSFGGNFFGVYLRPRPIEGWFRVYQYHGDATQPQFTASPVPYYGYNRTVAAVTVEAAPRSLINDRPATQAWIVGGFGKSAYLATEIPRIGADNAAHFLTGKMWQLALLRGAVSSPDMAQLSRLISEGVKPFCVRQ